MKKCPFCAEDIKNSATKCKHCKTDLSKEERKSKQKINPTGAVVFFGILLLIIVATVASSSDPYYDADTSDFSSSTAGLYDEPSVCDIHEQMANAIIEGYINFPREARKPSCYKASLTKNLDGTYTMTGYVIAPNAFGVEDEVHYSVELQFNGGSSSDLSNWENIGEPIIY